MQCLQRYKVVRIQVEDNIRARCPSLAKPGSGVITKWIESECAFCIIGIKQLVDVSERCLQDNINRVNTFCLHAMILPQTCTLNPLTHEVNEQNRLNDLIALTDAR